MGSRTARNWHRITWIAALAFTMAVGLFSLFFAIIGLPSPSYEEGRPGQPLGPPIIVFYPAPHLFIPFFTAVTTAMGLLIRRMAVAWLGAIVLLGFSMLFGLSLGSVYVPLAGILILLLWFHQSQV